MDLLMSCGRRDEHARMLRPVCCRPQLSTACSVVTSRRLAIIMAHSRLGTAERQMWRHKTPALIPPSTWRKKVRQPADSKFTLYRLVTAKTAKLLVAHTSDT